MQQLNQKPGEFNKLFQWRVMGLAVQEPLMYEDSLWLFTWRGICLTLVKVGTSAMSDKTRTPCAIARHKWPSASLAVICTLKPSGVTENKADRC